MGVAAKTINAQHAWGKVMFMVHRVLGATSIVIAAAIAAASPAQASDITFEFNNPSFGGDSFNSAHMLAIASAQNKYKDPESLSEQSDADQFLRTLQSRLLSSLATQITDLIFGENAQESGLIRFGDQEISFVRGIDSVTLTITDNATGSVTQIVIPLLQNNGPG